MAAPVPSGATAGRRAVARATRGRRAGRDGVAALAAWLRNGDPDALRVGDIRGPMVLRFLETGDVRSAREVAAGPAVWGVSVARRF